MADDVTTHPDNNQLVAFGMGRLDPENAATIESHLDECPTCCETLLDLKDDTFVALLRTAPETPPVDADLNEVATDFAGVRPDDKPADDESFDETILVQSGNATGPAGLPVELANHPRYRIVGLIGRGGMGDVYKAEHRVMNRTVALKVINRNLTRNSQALERFRREIQAAARLTHPNIVTAHDAEQAGGAHYLVMEYVDGTDLAQVVKEEGPLDVARACDYIRQAATGLQHAHEQGMVHRDIKPHNLMVTPANQVKILDFGLATLAEASGDSGGQRSEDGGQRTEREADSSAVRSPTSDSRTPSHLTTAGTMMGTPDFISPEQAGDARSVDIRSDVYSLGCTLYYLLTGRPPFDEGSVMDRVKSHADAVAEPIENVRVDVPADLADVIRRMMAKDPAERFQSPSDVANALAPFVDTHRTSGVGDRSKSEGEGWSGCNRFAVVCAILTAACLLLALLGRDLFEVGVIWLVGAMFAGGATAWWKPGPFTGTLTRLGWLAWGATLGLAGIIVVTTDRGTLEIDSIDDSVNVVLSQVTPASDGDGTTMEAEIVDTVNGSTVRALPSGTYSVQLQGDDSQFDLNTDRFVLKRGGKVIVKVTRKASAESVVRESVGDGPTPVIVQSGTAQALKSLIAAAQEIETDDQWKAFLEKDARVLSEFPTEVSRPLVGLLTGLPSQSQDALLHGGYLKWRFKDLDAARQDTMRGMYRRVLAEGFGGFENHKVDEELIDRMVGTLQQADVGFAVVNLPDAVSQSVVWYLLIPNSPIPIMLPISTTKQESKVPLISEPVYKQLSSLEHHPYSELPSTSVSSARTREALDELLAAINRASTDDEWKSIIANNAPVLLNVPLEDSRGLLMLLAGLPDDTRETLLEQGYLRWRADTLDEQGQSAVLGILSALNSSFADAGGKPHESDHFQKLLPLSDVGFVVLGLPDSDEQAIGWYLLDRKLEMPSIILVSGSTLTAIQDLMQPEVRDQVKAVLEKPYSDDVWQPVATAEMAASLDTLVTHVAGASTDEQWKALIDEDAPPLLPFPAEVGRDVLTFLRDLPAERRAELLQRGYLKWKVNSLDASQQEAVQRINRGIMLAWTKDSKVGGLEIDQLTDSMASMVDVSDVGFAVIEPTPRQQAVVWYLLTPQSPMPVVLMVCKSSGGSGDLTKKSYLQQMSRLKETLQQKPYSRPLQQRVTTSQTRQAFEELVIAARQAKTTPEWDAVLAEHAPILTFAGNDRDLSKQFGKAEMALMQEAGRTLVDVLAQLPDDVQDDLLQTGYLKWKFNKLDESRQQAMRDALTDVLSSSSKLGFPVNLKDRVPKMLASGDVGFAILNESQTDGQLVVWYLQIPDAPVPIMFPILNATAAGGVPNLSKSVYKQLGELEDKPYSDLMPLLKPADMQRLQGVWNFIRGEANGKPATPRTLEVAANVWLMKNPQTGQTLERMTFEIDPTQEPKQMTVTHPLVEKSTKAIYRFDGDELHITSASTPGGERPTEFDEGGEGKFFVVMRRQPPPDVQRMNMEEALLRQQEQQYDSERIPYAVWESKGKAVLRFANWLLLFEGIDAAPGMRGLGAFRVPHKKYDDSKRTGGGATYGTENSPLKLIIDERIVDGIGTVSVDEFEFQMRGRAETLTLGETSYQATDAVQTVVIRADGTTTIRTDEQTKSGTPEP